MVHSSLSRLDNHVHHLSVGNFPTDKTIKWSDGTPTAWSNWGIRKPEMDPTTLHLCVALSVPTGAWQLSPCQEKKGFICKMEAGG